MLYPIAWTVWLSLNGPETALSGRPTFNGLGNYVRIAGNARFPGRALADAWHRAGELRARSRPRAAVALALHRGFAAAIFSAIVALPLMVAPVVGALAWRFMFVDGYGMIDSIAGAFGANGPLWFADIWLARASIVIANLWLALPFDILVLLAGLASLPTDPLEAARVDGASPWQMLVSSCCRC